VNCFGCGNPLSLAAGERVGFRDECPGCGADLHVCRNCAHHEPSAYNECRESNAERVSQRDRANRCDYFAPGDRAGGGEGDPRSAARSQLGELFKKR
jgi:hypothetical protein